MMSKHSVGGASERQESLAAIGTRLQKRFEALQAFESTSEQAQRFEIWAINLGLYRTGHSSLDYRFRDAPLLFEYAYNLLSELEDLLPSVEKELDVVDPASEKDEEDETSSSDNSDSEDDCDSDDERVLASFKNESVTKVLNDRLKRLLNSLYRLSFKVRNPNNRIGFSKAAGYREEDKDSGVNVFDAYQEHDRRHILEELRAHSGLPYDALENHFLVERLSKANVRRRQQFGYWRNQKLKKMVHRDVPKPSESQPAQAPLIHPVSIPFRSQAREPVMSLAEISKPSTATRAEDVLVPLDLDETASLVSVSTYAVESHDSEQLAAHVPPLPQGPHNGKDFECPYCYILCSKGTARKKDWENHVFKDLRPYICTYENCRSAEQMFDRIADFKAHEAQVHANEPERKTCPMCPQEAGPYHIASHLRKIALFALPRSTGLEEADQADSNDAAAQSRSSGSSMFSSGNVVGERRSSDLPILYNLTPEDFKTLKVQDTTSMPGARLLRSVLTIKESDMLENCASNFRVSHYAHMDAIPPELALEMALDGPAIALSKSLFVYPTGIFSDIPDGIYRAHRFSNGPLERFVQKHVAICNQLDDTRIWTSRSVSLEYTTDDDGSRMMSARMMFYIDERQFAPYLKAPGSILVSSDDAQPPKSRARSRLPRIVRKVIRMVNFSDKVISSATHELGIKQRKLDEFKTLCEEDEETAAFLVAYAHGGLLAKPVWESSTGLVTPLALACSRGRRLLAELLLLYGADPNMTADMQTPLSAASAYGSLETVRLLLDYGADVNDEDSYGHRPLTAACRVKRYSHREHISTVRLLLDHGAKVNWVSKKDGTPLQAACASRSLDMVALLLDKGAQVNAQVGPYHRALDAACSDILRTTSIVRLLLHRGADVNCVIRTHGTPLQAACTFGNLEMVALLLDKGAEINAQGGRYHCALTAACTSPKASSTVLVRLLLDRGAKVDLAGDIFGPPLQVASYYGNKNNVLCLLARGADVNLESGRYQFALTAACHAGSLEVVRTLLACGAHVNGYRRRTDVSTPLEIATGARHGDIVELLEAGAAQRQLDDDSDTNLVKAVRRGEKEVVKDLIREGANLNFALQGHATALEVASSIGDTTMVELLLEAGAVTFRPSNIPSPILEGDDSSHAAMQRFADQIEVQGDHSHTDTWGSKRRRSSSLDEDSEGDLTQSDRDLEVPTDEDTVGIYYDIWQSMPST